MNSTGKSSFPRWIFAVIAIGALPAAGIFVGIMSVEGVSALRLIQAASFGLLGVIMFWGAVRAT